MENTKKVIRQIITKDESGNEVIVDIGSDDTRILVDDGSKTLDVKLSEFIKVTDHPFFPMLMSSEKIHPLLAAILRNECPTWGDIAGIPREEQGKK